MKKVLLPFLLILILALVACDSGVPEELENVVTQASDVISDPDEPTTEPPSDTPSERWAGVTTVGNANISINGVETQSDSSGNFEVSVPPAADGRNVINAEKDGYLPISQIQVGAAIDGLTLEFKPLEQFTVDPTQPIDTMDSRGTQISIDENSLVDADGNPPTGEVTLNMYTYDLANEEMVGDMSGTNTDGDTVFMESAGAFYASFEDEAGGEYNLMEGAEAEISVNGGRLEDRQEEMTVWSYNEETGLWEEEGVATFEDGRYVANVSHFSYWNFDVEAPNPACIKVEVDETYLAQNKPLKVKAVLQTTPPTVKDLVMNEALNMLMNVPNNTDVQFFNPPDATTPFATVNSGAPWGKTSVPPHPYDVCNGTIKITGEPPEPDPTTEPTLEPTLEPSPEPVTCEDSTSFDVLFVVDNSGSISEEEFESFNTAIQSLGDSILATNTIAKVGIVHYGGPEVSGYEAFGRNISIERDFSRDPMSALTRAFGKNNTAYPDYFMDNLAGAMEEIFTLVDNDSATTSSFLVNDPANMARQLGNAGHVVIFTDGDWEATDDSTMIDSNGPTGDWDIYDQFKNNSWQISLIRVGNTSDADKVAAIASTGGDYTDAVAANPNDPDGSGATPRLFHSSTSFDFSAAAQSITSGINDLCSESVIEEPPQPEPEPEPVTCEDSSSFDVLFVVDNSSSISEDEFESFTNAIQSLGDTILATNTIAKVGVVHYGGPDTIGYATFGRNISVERDFSRDPMSPLTRAFGNANSAYPDYFMDNLAGAMEEILTLVDNDSATTSSFLVSGPADMARQVGDAGHVVIFTDGGWNATDNSTMIDSDGPTGDWDIYDQFKNNSWQISVIRVEQTDDADKIAAIASLGGDYTGAVAANPNDPDGSGATPRLFHSSTSFDFSAAAQSITSGINDLCADSVIEEPPQPQPATLQGQVTDAVSGNPLAGAQVCINATSLCATTDADGNYTIADAPVGDQTLGITADGYIGVDEQAVVIVAGEATEQPVALSPELAVGELRIVLTWGEAPEDLDSHLFLPDNTDIDYNVEGQLIQGALLDLDDVNGNGPETITIQEQQDGTYTYAVYNFSRGVDDASATTISAGSAVVRVYRGDQEIHMFTPPAGDGNWWHVFDIDGATGTITPVNTLSDTSPR